MAGSRAARSLLFSRWFSGLLARARNAAIYGVLLLLRFWAGLRAVLFGARARPMLAFWVGARLGPRRLASPASSGVGTGHIIAQDAFLIQKHDMTSKRRSRPEAAGPENKSGYASLG